MGSSEENEKETEKECDVVLGSMAGIVFIIYTILLVFGIIYYTSCVDTRIAMYSVVQGITVMLNTVLYTTCLMKKWVGKKRLFLIGSPILIFNLCWSIQGALWLYTTICPNNVLYWYAVATSVPLWIVVGLYCFSCWCC